MACLILLTDYANESTTNDELFLKAENIMQEVPRTLYNVVKIPAELEKPSLDLNIYQKDHLC